VGILIDATVLIDHERGRLDLAGWIAGREDETFFLSVITVSELLHGVHRADTGVRKARRSMFVEAVIDRLPVLPLGLPSARAHAEIHADVEASGRVVGAHDLWLAASALAHDLTLATANLREFRRISGLAVEDWSVPRS
jgi:tRNA(fMet)-specific endonuclease VapC